MKAISWFKELGKGDVNLVGGKGANLGEMVGIKLPIPPGFVVNVEGYKRFLKESGIEQKIYKKLKGLDVEDTEKLNKASREIKEMIVSAKVPAEVSRQIVSAYKKLCMSKDVMVSGKMDIPVAVRSSATAEDLPGASFAGQQVTLLGIHGKDQLIDAVQDCWASLFEARSIYYRVQKGFPHEKVLIAVVVQSLVMSEKAGVMFSMHPATGERNKIVIEAGWGLGEAVVSGSVTPDTYIIDKKTLKLLEKSVVEQSWMYKALPGGGEQKIEIYGAQKKTQKLTPAEISRLSKLAIAVERHYNFPQDMEWAIEGRNIYLVQTRPVTAELGEEKKVAPEAPAPTSAPEAPPNEAGDAPSETAGGAPSETAGGAPSGQAGEAAPSEQEAIILVKGLAASPGSGSGPVKLIKDASEIGKVVKGDVLTTRMTNPDMVPAMEKTAAIVTDEGGLTCHASIVSRELGIPCIVGTKNATEVLKGGQQVTVDATRGIVLEGKVEVATPAKAGPSAAAAAGKIITATMVKANIDFPRLANEAFLAGADGVGLLRAEHMLIAIKKHPSLFIKEGRREELIERMVRDIGAVAERFFPKPVWYRTLDAPSDEFRHMEGGEDEPEEDNPMLGWRGIRRDIVEVDFFKCQLEAIKRLRDKGLTNVGVMLPLVQQAEELKKAKEIARQVGLTPEDMDFGVMIETPGAALTIDEFIKEGISFISFGTNDLTQYTLAIDRNNSHVIDMYDPLHPAVLFQIKYVIERCKKAGVKTSICGQAASDPKMAEFLVRTGIDSVSVNVDAIPAIRELVARTEKKILLEKAISKE